MFDKQAEFTDLDRLVLERSKTAAEAITVLTGLLSKYGQTCRRCPEASRPHIINQNGAQI